MFDNERLRQRRIDMGMTQEEVGQPLGISRSAVNKYERGVIKNVYTSVVEGFAAALHCSPGYLMGWTDNPLEGCDDASDIPPQSKVLSNTITQLNDVRQSSLEQFITLAIALNIPITDLLTGSSPEAHELANAMGLSLDPGVMSSGKSSFINALIHNPQFRMIAALNKLNEEGQEKAVERIEELTEVPKYQLQTTEENEDTP